MDSSYPDPSLIGQAFVKQYYTQLHNDPRQMHRFYLDRSSMVHGGSEVGSAERVIGQMAIHEKILSMDLQQVHAKIKQVDSDTTLGDGIAIQVTGELSTGGQPMRAFVQMFVLAPESPKKYYVRNDFFRYQDDELVSECETNDGPGEGEVGAGNEQPTEVEMEYRQQQPTGGMLPEGVSDSNALYGSQGPELVAMGDQVHSNQVLQEEGGGVSGGTSWDHFPSGEPTQIPEIQQNGMTDEEEVNEAPPTATPTSAQPDILSLQSSSQPAGEMERDEEETGGEREGYSMETQVTETVKVSPGTWADRLSKGFGLAAAPKPAQPPVVSAPPHTNRAPPPSQQQSQQSLPQREPNRRRPQEREKPLQKDFPPTQRKVPLYREMPDTNQIFVGGLPQNTTEAELKEILQQFGVILEVRINPKNFAFVVFESPECVQKVILEREHLQVRGKALNIEQKKPSAARMGGVSRPRPNIPGGGGGLAGKPPRNMKPQKR